MKAGLRHMRAVIPDMACFASPPSLQKGSEYFEVLLGFYAGAMVSVKMHVGASPPPSRLWSVTLCVCGITLPRRPVLR